MLIVSHTNTASIQSVPHTLTTAGKAKSSQQSGAHPRQWLVEHFWPFQPVEGSTQGYTSDSMRSESLIFSPVAVLAGINPKKDQYSNTCPACTFVSRLLSILQFPVSDMSVHTTSLELAPQSMLAHVYRVGIFLFSSAFSIR